MSKAATIYKITYIPLQDIQPLFTGGVSNPSGLTLHSIVLEKVLLGHGHQLAVAWVIRTHHADDGLVDVLIMALAVGAEFILGLGWTGN